MTEAVIWVGFTEPGVHHWPDAPERRRYLADSHRHLFHVRVLTTVTHDDREIEFHDLQNVARLSFKAIGYDKGARSCEDMARHVAKHLAAQYGRQVTVEVSEDGECGAVVIEG